MKLVATIIALVSLSLMLDARAQGAPHASVVQALGDGILEVCLPARVVTATTNASGDPVAAARDMLARIEGWSASDPLPRGIVPRFSDDAEIVHLNAAMAPGTGRVVAVVGVSPTSTTCNLAALDAPRAAESTIKDFRTRFVPLGTPDVTPVGWIPRNAIDSGVFNSPE